MNYQRFISRVVIGCVLCLSGSAWAQAHGGGDIEAKIADLQRQIQTLRGAQKELDASEANATEITKPIVKLTRKQRQVCRDLGLDTRQVAELIAKPLYEFDESEVDVFLRYLCAFQPDLSKRIKHLARKNIGQPYEIYLLGELPFEHYDPQPLYNLERSDCLVYAEHTYAMALTDSWPGFMQMLQRIRYKDGQIGVATRNHYTESDWNPNNDWLVRDITQEVARNKAVHFTQKVDRAKFLLKRYGLKTDIPIEEVQLVFIRFEDIDQAKPRLRDGDFVNIVRGRPGRLNQPTQAGKPAHPSAAKETMRGIFGGSAWVGHAGLIVLGDDGEVHLIHSTSPQVREEPIDDYIARSTENNDQSDSAGKARLLGFKFLRLRNDPWKNLREIDGENAPRVTLPGGNEADLK